MNAYARELNILKEKDSNFTGADIRNGMTAIISIKHPDPRFEGQTKTKLDNQDAAKATGKITGDELPRYFDKNLDTLKNVLSCAEKAAKKSVRAKKRPKQISFPSPSFPLTPMESWPIVKAGTLPSAKFSSSKEIRREVPPKRPGTATSRRFFQSAERF